MSKIIPSSYELLQFYVYYIDWVTRSNVKDNAMFSKNICLTESIFRYWHTGRKCTHSEAMRIVAEYLEQLQKAELPVLHPFNESKEELEQECREGKCHLNEKRIEWVRQRLADAGKPPSDSDYTWYDVEGLVQGFEACAINNTNFAKVLCEVYDLADKIRNQGWKQEHKESYERLDKIFKQIYSNHKEMFQMEDV